MKKIVAVVMVVALSSLFLGCLTWTPPILPVDLMPHPDEIPGDWEVTDEEFLNRTWDRRGGTRMMAGTFELSGSALEIEIISYGLVSTAERDFPIHQPPAGASTVEIEIGDEALFWSLSPDSHFVHFRKGGIVVHSSLSSDSPDLDGDWLIELMIQLESRM